MAPGGPRPRPQQHPPHGGYAPARPPQGTRNEVFENIFGRPAGGHHLGHGPPGHPGMGGRPAPPFGPGGGGGGAGGGGGGGGGQLLNPAQPSYPPMFPQPMQNRPPFPSPQQQQQQHHPPPQGGHQPPQRAPSQRSIYDRYMQQGAQSQSSPYDGVAMFDGPSPNGYGQPRQRQPSHGQEPPSQLTQASVPNRRTSLKPAGPGGLGPPIGGFTPANGPNGQRPPPTHYNGYAASGAGSGGGDAIGMPVPQLHPRSVSATSAQAPNNATVAANVPPRSRSLHHPSGNPSNPNGPSKISVKIPSPNLGSSSLLPFPEMPAGSSSSTSRGPSPPPDYVRAMDQVNLSSERPTPTFADDMAPLPPRREPNSNGVGALKGPWEPTDFSSIRDSPQRPASTRHMSTSSASSARRSMHMRQPSDSSINSVYTVGQRVAPLSQINNYDGPDSPLHSPSTPTGSDNGYGSFHRLSGRKSMESTHSLPLPTPSATESPLPPGAATSVFDHRAMSFSGSGVNRNEVISAVRSSASTLDSTRGAQGLYAGGGSPVTSQRSLRRLQSGGTHKRTAVLSGPVNPSLLSNVAEAFRQMIDPHEIVKDGLTYKDAFNGRSAVSVLAEVIKTPDRNLALLLGRALDAQKFFHDVTYAHRLRDTDKEVYQFKERLVAPFMSNDSAVMDSPSSDHLGLATRPPSTGSGTVRAPYRQNQASDSTTSLVARPHGESLGAPATLTSDEEAANDLPNGVFTLLTDCYSPTCSREQLCYSINCPRRLEQMKRLNMKSAHPGLQRKLEEETVLDDVKETGTLWIHSVSQEVLDSVDDKEKKRQEAINEVIYTERDFVRGLEYLRDSWIKPLRTEECIPARERDAFIHQVFWNVLDVLKVNHVLAERLTKRQKQQPVVASIGDIFLECVPHFEPFVEYGAHQLFGKFEFEKQKSDNPAFHRFVDETERKPEAHKLELNGYLTKPTTRLGRYPLLLEAVLKYTPDDHPDKQDLPEVIKMIRAFLAKVNVASGKSENIFELAQLEQQLRASRQNEAIISTLKLRDPSRELIHKGPMKRRGGTQGENADLLAFLFDHAFLLVKPKWVNKSTEQYRVFRRPISLQLLVIHTPEDANNSGKLGASRTKQLISRNASKGGALQQLAHVPPKPESKHGFLLNVHGLGRGGFTLPLWIDTYVSRKKWIECIEKQQQLIRDNSTIFVNETITEGFFQGLRCINCLSPYDNGNRMIYGTDEGVYFSNLRDPKLREPVKVINLIDVTQVDVIEELQLLLVLHERSVTTFPLDCLDPNDPNSALKRGKRISSHTSFFKSGICLGRTLVAVVKSSPLSSTIKVFEPVDQNVRGKKPQTGFMRRLNNSQDTLRVFKEFYIPLESFSVYFLKTKLCVGCHKGFEIVDLETLDMQSLLDPSDPSLEIKREGARPMAIYRIESNFLLCYDDVAFYVNKNGWRARQGWAIHWEGTPTSFALHYPYVIAFDSTFIEVRHVESAALVQVITGNNITCLFADMPPSTVNAPPPPPQSRQLMYPSPGGGGGGQMFRPPYPPQQGGYGGYGGPPQFRPQQGMVRPPMPGGYGMPPPQPMPPFRNFLYRPQIIFKSDEGHVQFLKLPPPQKIRRSSDSKSTHSGR